MQVSIILPTGSFTRRQRGSGKDIQTNKCSNQWHNKPMNKLRSRTHVRTHAYTYTCTYTPHLSAGCAHPLHQKEWVHLRKVNNSAMSCLRIVPSVNKLLDAACDWRDKQKLWDHGEQQTHEAQSRHRRRPRRHFHRDVVHLLFVEMAASSTSGRMTLGLEQPHHSTCTCSIALQVYRHAHTHNTHTTPAEIQMQTRQAKHTQRNATSAGIHER